MLKKYMLFCLILLFTGCHSSNYKDYSYTRSEIEVAGGEFLSRITGKTKKLDSGDSVKSEPYTMVLRFSTYEEHLDDTCFLSLTSILFKDAETNEIVLIPQSTGSVLEESSGSALYDTRFEFRNLYFPYVDYNLTFDYSFSKQCQGDNSPGSVSMNFETQFEEETLALWEVLMRN